jgi:hypothetical protein
MRTPSRHKTSKQRITLKAEHYVLGSPEFARPKAKEHPEFVSILLRAIEHFDIDASAGRYPKKDELVKYFREHRLSNGAFISRNMAEALATCCRSVEAMVGGNKKGLNP